jgi:hypothetical protein
MSLGFLYLLLLGVFHLGMVVPVAAGVEPPPLTAWLLNAAVPEALGLVAIACAAFAFGAVTAAEVVGRAAPAPLPTRTIYVRGGAVAALAGFAMLLVGVVQLQLLTSPYSEYWERALTDDVRLFGFGMLLFPMGLLIAASGTTPRGMRFIAGAYAAVYLPLFLVGFRGHAVVHGVALLVVWSRKAPVVAKKMGLWAAAAIVLLSPVVRMARSWEKTLFEAVKQVQPLDFFLEAGGSLRPLAETASLIDSGSEPLWYGESYLLGISRLLPNVAMDASRADTRLGPAQWITMKAEPLTFARGGGLGFSCVAEPYLNFGTVGVLGAFLLLGATLIVLERRAFTSGATAAVACSTFGSLLWTVRNDMSGLPRAVVYASILVFAIRVVQSRSRARPSGRLAGDGGTV